MCRQRAGLQWNADGQELQQQTNACSGLEKLPRFRDFEGLANGRLEGLEKAMYTQRAGCNA